MKKLLLSVIFIALTFNVMAINVWDGTSEPWNEGEGTRYNPYRIETAANLAYLAEKVNEGYQSFGQGVFDGKCFLLTNDLDLNNLDWTPIGNVDYDMNGYYFAGCFDGGYHQIENLRIQTSADLAGLFAAVGDNGDVCNLSVSGTVISTGMGASGVVGGIAGDAKVYRCSFSGSVSVTNGGSYCGAAGVVAGATQNSNVIECSSSANVTVTNSNFMGAAVAGGVVCFARGNALIDKCYNTGSVNASALLMGISGGILGATVESAEIMVYSCYNVGQISGGTSGGIFGMVSPIDPTKAESEINVTNCFFLNSAGGNNGYGTGMTTDEMKTEQFKNQIDQSTHSFVMDNGINNGYPIHSLVDFILMEALDVTPHTAKLSAWIHQGNDHIARAYFYYSVWDAVEWTEIEVTTDGYVETMLENLQESTDYTFGMSLMFDDGIVRDSGPRYFTTDYDAVEEMAQQVRVYPNPTTEMFYIQGLEPVEVQVFNAIGQTVRILNNINKINVSDLIKGVYVLHITDVNGIIYNKKVIVK